MPTKQQKLIQAIKLAQAKEKGTEAVVLLEKMDLLEDKIDAIKPTDISELDNQVKDIRRKISEIRIPEEFNLSSFEKEIILLKDKIDEPIEVELQIE